MRFFWLLLLLALLLRLLNLGHESLWLDEIYSMMVANVHPYPATLDSAAHPAAWWVSHYLAWQPMDVKTLVEMLSYNVHMPLFYLLLNPWLGWFGLEEVSLRSFAVVFSMGMLWPVYQLAKAMTGNKTAALWAMAFCALSPFQLYFAQEGRMYTLALFLSALCGWTLWQASTSPKPLRWGLAYTAALLAGVFAHYTFVFQVAFHGVWILVSALRKPDRRYWIFLLPLALLVLGAMLWFPIYNLQQSQAFDQDHFSNGLLKPLRYLGTLFWEPAIVLSGDNRWARLFYFPIILVLCGWGLWQSFRFSPRTQEEREAIGFLLTWIFIPLLAHIGVDVLQKSHTVTIVRYTMLIAPAVYLLLGLVISRALASLPSGRWIPLLQRSVAVLMLLVALGTVWPPSPLHYTAKFRMRDITGFLTARLQPGDLVVVNGPLGAPNTLAHYLAKTRPQQPLLHWMKTYRQQENIPLPPASQLAPYRRVWLLSYRGNRRRGLNDLRTYLAGLYPRVQRFEEPDGKRWILYRK